MVLLMLLVSSMLLIRLFPLHAATYCVKGLFGLGFNIVFSFALPNNRLLEKNCFLDLAFWFCFYLLKTKAKAKTNTPKAAYKKRKRCCSA